MRTFIRAAAIAGTASLLAASPVAADKANDTLIWTSQQEIATVDPYYGQVRPQIVNYRNACDSLIYRDPVKGDYLPHIATSWTWVDDTTLDLELRKDVKFHDGRMLSADDVVYTFNHVTDPNSGVLAKSNVNWMSGAEKLGDYKVRLKLPKPFPAALEYLSGSTPILPKGHYDNAEQIGTANVRNFAATPLVCTGPYKIAKFIPGESVQMVRHEEYFGGAKGKANIMHLVFRTIPDAEAQIAALLSGDVDWIQDVVKDKAEAMQAMPDITVVQSATLRTRFIRFEVNGKKVKSPFMDVRVRQAVNHAINRPAVSKNLVGGASQVLHAACHPAQFGCTDEVRRYDYDPAKAKALLAEAGYPDGFETDFYAWRERSFTEALLGDLAAVGIKTNLRYMQWNTVRPLMHDGTAVFTDASWGSFGIMDTSALAGFFFGGSPDDGAQDPELIEMIKAGDTATDPEQRKAHYKKALQRIADMAYWAPLFTYAKYYAYDADLEFTPHVDDIARFWLARWK
jgi:peptide/nickel transport system substrate-binding protein